jgi:hypothetical protein
MKEDIMKKTLWILAAIGALLLAVAALRGEDSGEKAAQEATRSWLALVDSGKYAESWKQAASYFQKAVTLEQWQTAVGNARSPLGEFRSRQLKSSQSATTLPGAPDGDYVVMQYDTTFENKKSAVETVTAMKDKDGSFRVAGYFIK